MRHTKIELFPTQMTQPVFPKTLVKSGKYIEQIEIVIS